MPTRIIRYKKDIGNVGKRGINKEMEFGEEKKGMGLRVYVEGLDGTESCPPL